MAVSCAATADVGRWNDSWPGCTPSGAWSPDGSTISRTSSASCISPASTCCSGIYETASTGHEGSAGRGETAADPGSGATDSVARVELFLSVLPRSDHGDGRGPQGTQSFWRHAQTAGNREVGHPVTAVRATDHRNAGGKEGAPGMGGSGRGE